MPKGNRRQARVAALQALFESDTSDHRAEDALSNIVTSQRVPPESVKYAQELIERVLAGQDEIDRVIADAAPQWPVEQMPAIDKNILRLAIWEMLADNGTPVKAAINEAVELAKQFGSENSAKFVNGVLGTIARRRQEADPDHVLT